MSNFEALKSINLKCKKNPNCGRIIYGFIIRWHNMQRMRQGCLFDQAAKLRGNNTKRGCENGLCRLYLQGCKRIVSFVNGLPIEKRG